ncbi:MAG: guanylate kinase, partial [Oscillospiraceae bacterium]
FESMIKSGELLEYAEYVGNYYGTPKAPVFESLNRGKNVIFDIEVQGAMQIKQKCPNAALIFIVPPSFSEIEKRLRGRHTDSESKILQRLETARSEYAQAINYDYIVINDHPQKAANEVKAIISAEKCRVEFRKKYVLEV